MIYKFDKTAEGHEKWLKFRTTKITATESASFLGLNPYESANSILESKKKAPVALDNPPIRRGKAFEGGVLELLRYDLGWEVDYLDPSNSSQYIFSRDGLSATPDAFRFDVSALVEAKTTSLKNFEKYWRDGNPPEWYVSQTQVQMHCTDMPATYLACVVPTDDPILTVTEISYSAEYVELLQQAILAFTQGLRTRINDSEKAKARELLAKATGDTIVVLGHKNKYEVTRSKNNA